MYPPVYTAYSLSRTCLCCSYKEFFAREYSSSRARDFDNFDVPPSFSSSNPQPNQAKRFLKQAQEDLRASENDYDVSEPAFEWACFKAHQVCSST